MKLYYLSYARIPAERANSIQQMRMCEAFATQGVEVILVHPFHFQTQAMKAVKDIWDYYGIERRFKIVTLPALMGERPHTFTIPKIGGLSMRVSFALFSLLETLRGDLDGDVIVYSRNVHATSLLLRIQRFLAKRRVAIFFEAHAHYKKEKSSPHPLKKVLEEMDGVVTITEALRNELINSFAVPTDKIVVEPDGVNLKQFERSRMSKEEARARLGLPPQSRKIICYSGHLYEDRGGDILLEAAEHLANEVVFLFVGGYRNDLARLDGRPKDNVIFTGFVSPSSVPLYLFAADVLVIPYTLQIPTVKYTSPLKMFEYMGAGRPIVASRLSVFEEILEDGKNAILVEPENAVSLANGIKKVLEDERLAQKLANQAYLDVQDYTWNKRAQRILDFMAERRAGKR